jgi:hypothetical protein
MFGNSRQVRPSPFLRTELRRRLTSIRRHIARLEAKDRAPPADLIVPYGLIFPRLAGREKAPQLFS